MSAMAAGFADLIAPLTPADIAALWRGREIKLQRRTGDNRFPAIADWGALWSLIENGTIPADDCRVTYGRRIVAPAFYVDAGKINPAKLAKLLEQGTSLVVLRIEPHLPALAAACRDAKAGGLRLVYAGAIATTGGGGAFDMHYDFHDLIILQVEGSKRWRIYGPRVLKPVQALAEKNPPQTPPILDFVLQPGDMLFLPAGFWHLCDNGPDRSLHVGLFLKMPKAGKPGTIDPLGL
jgi:hypothetical protein